MIALIIFILSQSNSAERITEIHKEIQVLNLINGLELSVEQMEFILEKAQQAKAIWDDFLVEIEKNEKPLVHTLEQLKDNRMQDVEISQDLRKTVHSAEEKLRDQRTFTFEAIADIAFEVEDMLDGNQLYQLEQYKPCLIPPPGESKIGQSENPAAIAKRLARLREIPDHLYEIKKYEIADRTVEKIKKLMPRYSEFNETEERKRILDLFDEIRSVDDVTFALNQNQYIEQLIEEEPGAVPPKKLSSKIERFLLDPVVIRLLDEKIKNSK